MTDRLTDRALDPAALLDQTADPESGALVVFGGTVRFDGRVQAIDYTAYRPLADKALREVEQATLARFGDVRQCRVLHRLGRVGLGELSVLVVVRAGHRAAAFEAAHWAIDALKQRVPVWKQEHYADGSSGFVEGVPLQAADAP